MKNIGTFNRLREGIDYHVWYIQNNENTELFGPIRNVTVM